MNRKIVKVRITGRVQGVAFRAWTKAQADRLDVTGWVRNEKDGSVSALIAGPEKLVAAMVDLLHQGPSLASVTDVEIQSVELEDMPETFRISG